MLSKKLGMSETSAPLGLQPSGSLSIKDVSNYMVTIIWSQNIHGNLEIIKFQENSISGNNSIINSVRERDKSYKRKSYLNRSLNMETTGDRSCQCK